MEQDKAIELAQRVIAGDYPQGLSEHEFVQVRNVISMQQEMLWDRLLEFDDQWMKEQNIPTKGDPPLRGVTGNPLKILEGGKQ